jgi:hypothetical protein
MTDKADTAALKALCKAQQEMTAAMADTKNEFFNSKYADLGAVQAACMPALHSNGFSVMHQLRNEDTGSVLDTILLHDSGASWTCPIPLIVSKKDMQGLGSAITYARRYGLMCLSGVAPEDDDGNKAVENKPSNNQDRVGAKTKASADDAHDFLVEAELKKLATITDIDELKSYWSALVSLQASIAKDSRVVIAKNKLKNTLSPVDTGKPGSDVDSATDDAVPY